MRHITRTLPINTKMPSKRELFEHKCEILQIIASARPDGFTVNICNGFRKETKGFAVAYKETQNSFGSEGLAKVCEHSLKNNNIVGGWLDNGKYYFDSVKVFSEETEAREFAIEHAQIAYFDLNNVV